MKASGHFLKTCRCSELHSKLTTPILIIWHAQVVASAAACLRPDGVFCSFSPCIEQVQRTTLPALIISAVHVLSPLARAWWYRE